MGPDKVPLVKWTEFQERLPSDKEIFRWFETYKGCQVGIVTGAISGLAVIDVEAGGDISIFPPTLTVNTGGGGHHLYYRHPGKLVINHTRICELTDIRGDGGYVVAPPSKSSKGVYSWVLEKDGDGNDVEFDLKKLPIFPVDLIESLLAAKNARTEVPIPQVPIGMRNDAAAKRVGEIVSSMGPERWESEAWPQLQAWNQTSVTEPLSDAELRSVFNSITARRQREVANKGSDEFVLKPFTLRQLYAENFPPVEWVAKNLVPLGCLGAMTGESNSYKSFLTLVLAQAVATGSKFLGYFEVMSGKVLIIDEENNRRIIEKRFKHMGITEHDNIVFLSQSGLQIDREHHRSKLLDYVNELKPRLIIMDSLVRFHGRDENSSTEMKQVMKALGSLVAPDRTVIFIHHHKKEQGFARKVGSGSLRGSTDIFNALDFHLAIARSGEENLIVKMLKLRVKQELPAFKVKIESGADESVAFPYIGQDYTREESLREIKETIVKTLTSLATEASRKQIQANLEASSNAINNALKELQKENVIKIRRGKSNEYHYSLVTDNTVPQAKVKPVKIKKLPRLITSETLENAVDLTPKVVTRDTERKILRSDDDFEIPF